MHLELKNFRQHRARTFDIPDEGLILISGEIGSGKSTLLHAISHALYGNVRKPCSFGTTTCSVLLQFKDITIERVTRPNRLTFKRTRNGVTKTKTDDEAQAAINRLFGSIDAFMTAVFVRQNIDCSILALKPVERVEFVKTLAFDNDDHVTIREGIKRLTKEYETARLRVEGGADYLERQLGDVDDAEGGDVSADAALRAIDKIDVKIKKLREEDTANEEALAHVEEVTRNIHEMVDAMQSEKDDLGAKRATLKRYLSMYADLFAQLPDDFKAAFLNVDPLTDDPLSEYTQQAAEMSAAHKIYLAYSAMQEKVDERDRLLTEHTDALRERIAKLEEHMITPEEKKRIEKLARRIDRHTAKMELIDRRNAALRRCQKAMKALSAKYDIGDALKIPKDANLSTHIATIDNLLTANARAACPRCRTMLSVINEEDRYKLTIAPRANATRGRKTKGTSPQTPLTPEERKELTEIRDELASVSEVDDEPTDGDREAVAKAIKEHTELTRRMQASEMNQTLYADLKAQLKMPPTFVKQFDDAIEKMRATLPKGYKPPKNAKTITREAVSTERAVDTMRSLLKTADAIAAAHVAVFEQEGRIRTSTTAIEERVAEVGLPEDASVDASSSGGGSKTDTSNPLAHHLALLDAHREAIASRARVIRASIAKQSDARNRYVEICNRSAEREKAATQLESMKAEVADLERHLIAIGTMAELSKKAELQAMKRTLEALNTNAALYLEDMFEDPMTIRLELDMESKKKSLKIRVEYRGIEYDDIDQLSGGERQLCNLAFIMAVNELTGSKFLMLDECLNNLDEETNSEVLTYLKERAEKRAIIIVSHEALRGIFDAVVEVAA